MTEHMIHVSEGRYQVHTTTTGRDRHNVGPAWPTPRAAVDYAKLLDEPRVSPLRGGAEPRDSSASTGTANRERL